MEDHLQKPDVIQQNQLEAPPEYSTAEPPDFSVLRLDHRHRHRHLHSPCANCGFSFSGDANSLKRPSPIVISQQPKPKKLFLDEPTAAATTTTHDDYPLLRRCVSDPYHAPPALTPPGSVAASGSGISSNTLLFSPSRTAVLADSSATPCSAAKGSGASSSDCPALPPLPPPPKLRRCISDPTPSPGKSFSRSSSSNDVDKPDHSKAIKSIIVCYLFFYSAIAWKLRKIWHCWKEMNMWLEEVMQVEQSEDQTESLVGQEETEQEQQQENGGVVTTPTYIDEANDNNVTTKNLEVELEESLSVERDGKCLNIKFKCHCGKGYHFLLSDGSCFYKLM